MIKIENTEIVGWKAAIRGMRNPMNSWEKSDSGFCDNYTTHEYNCGFCDSVCNGGFCIGDNDRSLMVRLSNGGPTHAKYRRMIIVYADVTAPLYWWKEFDTYKVGTVANSCSTIHKIHAKQFELGDFSHEHLGPPAVQNLKNTIKCMNDYREEFLKDKEKHNWWQMIQILPSSYNQRRTVMLNYEVLSRIYYDRRNHKLDEWVIMCKWIEELPHSEGVIH